MTRILAVALAMTFIMASQVFAQGIEDVVYLENGGIVRGAILEHIPDESLKIRRRDGRVFSYKMDEIEKIAKEPVPGSTVLVQKNKKNPMVALGLSFPIVGSGQFYNGQYIKGVAQMGAAVVGLGLVLSAGGDNTDSPDGNLDVDNDDWRSIPGYVLLVGGTIWSLIDAPMSAKRINRQNMQFSYGHLIELDGERTTVGIDPVTSRNRLGTVLTLRF